MGERVMGVALEVIWNLFAMQGLFMDLLIIAMITRR